MTSWSWTAIAAGLLFLTFYAYAVRFYLRGRGREDLEKGIKSFLIVGGNGAFMEIAHRSQGIILRLYRGDDELDSADVRLRIPFRIWSLPHSVELQQVFSNRGYEFATTEGSIEWIGEVRIPVANIWSVGSAAKAAEAVNLALDVMGFGPDVRFNFMLKGKKTWRRMGRRQEVL